MKRITIVGDFYVDSDGDWALKYADGYQYIPPDVPGMTVEDVPDPLPTEPGVRFWGRSTHFGPQWWFVCESTSCRPEDGEVDYVAAGGYRLSSYVAESTHGLVRLPDPEATP